MDRLKFWAHCILLCCASSLVSAEGLITFQPGQIIRSADINGNFLRLQEAVNTPEGPWEITHFCEQPGDLQDLLLGIGSSRVLLRLSGACTGSTFLLPAGYIAIASDSSASLSFENIRLEPGAVLINHSLDVSIEFTVAQINAAVFYNAGPTFIGREGDASARIAAFNGSHVQLGFSRELGAVRSRTRCAAPETLLRVLENAEIDVINLAGNCRPVVFEKGMLTVAFYGPPEESTRVRLLDGYVGSLGLLKFSSVLGEKDYLGGLVDSDVQLYVENGAAEVIASCLDLNLVLSHGRVGSTGCETGQTNRINLAGSDLIHDDKALANLTADEQSRTVSFSLFN